MCHLDFHASLRMSPKYGGWKKVPKEWMIAIPVRMGCNEIIITCTWNACILKQKRTKKITRFFFQAYIGHSLCNSTWCGVSRWDGSIAGSEWKEIKHRHAHPRQKGKMPPSWDWICMCIYIYTHTNDHMVKPSYTVLQNHVFSKNNQQN